MNRAVQGKVERGLLRFPPIFRRGGVNRLDAGKYEKGSRLFF
jgi:hypothetical protein